MSDATRNGLVLFLVTCGGWMVAQGVEDAYGVSGWIGNGGVLLLLAAVYARLTR